MVRTQIQLSEDQHAALLDLSAATGKSMAELVREGIDHILASRLQPNRADQIERALQLAGRFSSETRDGSVQHDRYFTDSIL
jgi:hypothetical protein